jgi:DNA-directed RNA polymerase subunit beta'
MKSAFSPALAKNLKKLENLHASFDYLKLTLASPQKLKTWAQRKLPNGYKIGEISFPETINFRSNKPELGGLFCEMTFGPTKDWRCHCGGYNGFAIATMNKICEGCNVEVTEARVRRYRMGFIQLTCPVVHYWYLKSLPNYLLLLLKAYYPELKLSDLDQIAYFREGDRVMASDNPLYDFFEPRNEEERIFVREFVRTRPKYRRVTENSPEFFYLNNLVDTTRKGSEIIKAALEAIDLPSEIERSRNLADEFTIHYSLGASKKRKLPDNIHLKRIRILESFLSTQTSPGWMVLSILSILPPSLRPLVELETGKLATADLNELYRLIIIRNNRIFEFIYDYEAPSFTTYHGRKLLQDSVDALIDNGRLPKNRMLYINDKPLKSLTEILEGKQGRFRQSLLGKRVDYSGRSVIVVNPLLRLNQCGLPFEMAVELFQPFLVNEYLTEIIQPPSHNLKLARRYIRKRKKFLWRLVETVSRKLSILLNRAPTLHRFGIQAFDPVVILGQAIQLHPLVCAGFNADFDGDQMAVHLPLYESSQVEAKTIMRPSGNILSPANGEVILKPTQDMVIGCYYLTFLLKKNQNLSKHWFSSEQEALACLYQKRIGLHTPILVRYFLNDFEIQIEKDQLKLSSKPLRSLTAQPLQLYKSFQKNEYEFYFLTNLGIAVAKLYEPNAFEITCLFFETTPGRLLFVQNLQNVFQNPPPLL